MTWKKIGSKSIYQDYWKGLELWKMRSDKGVEKDISISLSRNTVVIFGITDDNRVLLINEYFFSQNKMVISLPAGMVDDGMSPEEVAILELKQETGCKAKQMIFLGDLYRGKYVTGQAYVFLALGVEQVYEQDLEETENIEVNFVSLKELEDIMSQNKMKAMHQVSATYMALDYLKRNKLIYKL
ncbi:MAG: hypothetical protein A2725_02690 [Candidatus Magasanikbacteria bacterium RIFCSPHIGHO2_01_FULL_33_34]|uniref:Nudix hydrolase domain-containing protein n=1 Tax=Candidatus Magasanikbacteria bacterium RIFCSPHIGHO2_01_FULL_33_34 TaxID=1798671 RepID=A0A1F6LGX5_9BACT|nr:MAG: hypothetical protein A2725_02690 [Candidatus Magasanikbacteria bacterium RIFCSPHIGHO2_01_FULL_33_34]OGH66045.1 MAG: hypothetical protein A3B83_00180 [Candidatus Magasanikbacteria bacterium RIFCSPHIGHO2_02_FULL_33_17]OGH75891.1 MAG: hypothetical protein A3A89_00090 [Candidatus Magasanikbacteria bacterium RIFCSPLOWO2_01_FULL_33_34]OGH81669.1 MAG: hypothetical protein A3F93_01885 [Candidatus Magasanikbacteria bacterium RIFCSPLOWO2_12_FULL_34_7]